MASRDADHRKLESECRGIKTLLGVSDSMFHGIPERWRATNIAFKGFDLSIKINGRACGDGVYSATSMAIPLGYCGANGSAIIRVVG